MTRSHQAQPPAFLLATANSLTRLVGLRRIEVLTQAMVLVLAVAWLKIPLEIVPMTAVIALLAAVNLLTQWRVDTGGACSPGEVFGHLAIDVGCPRRAALLCRRFGQPLRVAVPAARRRWRRCHAAPEVRLGDGDTDSACLYLSDVLETAAAAAARRPGAARRVARARYRRCW
jgi:hypothetical protein